MSKKLKNEVELIMKAIKYSDVVKLKKKLCLMMLDLDKRLIDIEEQLKPKPRGRPKKEGDQ